MDWQNSMNKAMEYIEDNLAGSIDYYTIAQFMNCSEWEFRRIFSFLTQVPLSEYIRCRRLTMAAQDIRNGDKIIDVSMRYGYKSHAAFSRAFNKHHSISPSQARDKDIMLKSIQSLNFKLILMEGIDMDKDSNSRTNIIGAGEVGYAIAVDMEEDIIHQANKSFWDEIGNDVVGTTALPFYGAFVSEDKCKLFGDLRDKRVLEVGCGTGHSLEYIGSRGASELWGIDISNEQIAKTRQRLEESDMSAKLMCSPMEDDSGIPKEYFDYVYSVYGIGWTTDLNKTLSNIASYLRKDGVFIFSWSHPIHKCVAMENNRLLFKKNYFDESWYSVSMGGGALSLSDRKLSTYINALSKAGFIIEEMVEESDEDFTRLSSSGFGKKAEMLPVTFVIKARKI